MKFSSSFTDIFENKYT